MIGILFGTTGCLTQALIRQAAVSDVPFFDVAGTAQLKPNGPRCLVACYGNNDVSQLLLIPLDPTGRPIPPFAWQAKSVAPHQGLFDSVSESQRREINAGATAFTPDPKEKTGIKPPASPLVVESSDPALLLVCYRLKPDGAIEAVSKTTATPADQEWVPFPADACEVLLPVSRPVDRRWHRRKIAEALAFAPVTAAVDSTAVAAVASSGLLVVPGFWQDVTDVLNGWVGHHH